MEKKYIPSDSLMELELLTDQKTGIHYHNNFELLYLLNGSMELIVEKEHIHMEPEDIVMVNTNVKHGYESTEDLFIARFLISADKLRELLKKDSILFLCNSSIDKNEAFDALREVMGKILNQFLRNQNGRIYLNSLYYQILYILTSNFLLTTKDIRYEEKISNDERIQEVFAYIRMNYRHNITLQDVGKKLFLSTTYLSKYIKNKCGMNFGELINSVRMEHAIEDLLYTDEPIMKIAMDNGFASVAAYNKVFKEAHQMTPSEFRKKMRENSKKENKQQKQQELIQKKIENYLEQKPDIVNERKHVKILEIYADTREILSCQKGKNICNMINAGAALDLTKSYFQQQLLDMKDRIGFEYVRFWDIYAPEFYIDIHAFRNQVYFGRLDIIFDFLVRNKLKPYIELGFKPIRLLKTTQSALKETRREEEFQSDDEMWNFYECFMHHLVKRYGTEEVETWYFEYSENENLLFSNLAYSFSTMTNEGHEKYMHHFDILASALRSCLDKVKIGGGGFPLQHYKKKGFSKILELWKKHKEQPDFISITSFPYQQEKEGHVYYEKKNMDADFVLHNIELAKEVMEENGYSKTPIHVSEYSLSLSNRNVVNDSCIHGAFLMQNAIACSEKSDMLGYWMLTDAYSDFYDSQNLLFGGCGLLTKGGIPKPGAYALEFYNHLYKYVIAKGRNYVLTKSMNGNYRMICHNFKALNYNYYIA